MRAYSRLFKCLLWILSLSIQYIALDVFLIASVARPESIFILNQDEDQSN